jgi:hypothetical protein
MRLRALAAAGGLTIVFLTAAGTPAGAQLITVQQSGVKAGLAFTNLTFPDGDESPETDARAGFTGGVFAVKDLRRGLAIQAEALISAKGATFEDSRLRITYLEFPGLLRYNLAIRALERNPIHLLTGPALAFKIDAALSGDGTSEDVGEDIKSVDVGWVLGAGLDRDAFVVELRYTWGLADVTRDGDAPPDTVRNRSFAIVLGLRIPQ